MGWKTWRVNVDGFCHPHGGGGDEHGDEELVGSNCRAAVGVSRSEDLCDDGDYDFLN